MKKENDFCVEKGRKKRWGIPDKFLFEDSRELFVNAKVDDPKEIEVNLNNIFYIFIRYIYIDFLLN
jgi:hypothetical protein